MADTKTAVNTVTSLLKTAPQKVTGKIERIGDITYEARGALEKASKHLLGTLLNEAQKNLEAIGVSNSRLNKLIHLDRKSTRLNSSHVAISYAVFCLKKKKYIY